MKASKETIYERALIEIASRTTSGLEMKIKAELALELCESEWFKENQKDCYINDCFSEEKPYYDSYIADLTF